MNIDSLIRLYFDNDIKTPDITIFDDKSVFQVFERIVTTLYKQTEIELCVIQGFSYCLYEILDNVLTHSEKKHGVVISRFMSEQSAIQILVADDGIGIHKSLKENPLYTNVTEEEALSLCIQDSVTDGKGMGFGLFSMMKLIRNVGIKLEIHSGSSTLTFENDDVTISKSDLWQGTLIYFEVHSNKDFNPKGIVSDCDEQFNDMFLNSENLEDLW